MTARQERLDEREDAVPARDVELPLAGLDRLHDPLGDELRPDHRPAEEGAREHALLREAFRLDEAREDGVHLHAARAEEAGERAGERELRVLRRGVRPGRPERDDPATETTLTTCEPACSPGSSARTNQTPPR